MMLEESLKNFNRYHILNFKHFLLLLIVLNEAKNYFMKINYSNLISFYYFLFNCYIQALILFIKIQSSKKKEVHNFFVNSKYIDHHYYLFPINLDINFTAAKQQISNFQAFVFLMEILIQLVLHYQSISYRLSNYQFVIIIDKHHLKNYFYHYHHFNLRIQ